MLRLEDITQNISIVNPYNDSNSNSLIIQNNMVVGEYFYNMLPSYFFIITASVRLYSLKQLAYEEKKENVEHESLSLKIKISHLMCISYVIAIVLAWMGTPSLYWQSAYPFEATFYVFAVLSWNQSASLLKLEATHQIEQQIYTHKIFWIFSCSLNLVRMFQANEILLINILLNTARFILTSVLTMYAIYKPFDFDHNTYNSALYDQSIEVPTFALKFFELFENNPFIRKMFSMKEKVTQDVNIRLMERDIYSEQHKNNIDQAFEQYEDELNNRKSIVKQQEIEEEKLLSKQLPQKVVLAINKKLVKKTVENNQTRLFFQIVTQINNSRFISERRYIEFEELQSDLISIYNQTNFPQHYLRLPMFQVSNSMQIDDSTIIKRVLTLENYLKEILRQPIFMHKKVLEFLNINDDLNKVPYLSYFDFINRKNLKKNRIEQIKAQQKEMQQQQYQNTVINIDNPIIKKKENNQKYMSYNFDVCCIDFQKKMGSNTYEYLFQLQNISKTPRQQWNIYYTYTDIKNFNSELEMKLGMIIQQFNKLVPREPNQGGVTKDFLKSRQAGLQKYMKYILENKSHYCQCLFDFIQFNVIKDRPDINETPRQSIVNNDNNSKQLKNLTFDSVFIKNLDQVQGNFEVKEKREILNVDFNRTLIKIYNIKGQQQQDNNIYYIAFLEFDMDNQVKLLMKMSKYYQDIINLNDQIHSVYNGLNIPLPHFPSEQLNSHDKLKQLFDQYFEQVILLPQLEKNKIVQEFFELQRMLTNTRYVQQGSKQIHDFVHL